MAEPSSDSSRCARVVLVLLLATLLAVLAALDHREALLKAWMWWRHDLPTWVGAQDASTVLLLVGCTALVDTILVIGHLPTRVLQVALPTALGWQVASCLLFSSIFVSLMIEFAIGRCLCREPVLRLCQKHPWFAAIDRALLRDRDGCRLVVLFRLAPIPEVLSSYLLSVTAVRTPDYAIGAVVEAVKATCLVLYVDANLAAGEQAVTRVGGVDWVALLLLGVMASIFALVVRTLHLAIQQELERSAAAEPNSVGSGPAGSTEALV